MDRQPGRITCGILKALQGFEDQAIDRTGSLPRLAWVFASRMTNENNPNRIVLSISPCLQGEMLKTIPF
jgi:hypothetical protein